MDMGGWVWVNNGRRSQGLHPLHTNVRPWKVRAEEEAKILQCGHYIGEWVGRGHRGWVGGWTWVGGGGWTWVGVGGHGWMWVGGCGWTWLEHAAQKNGPTSMTGADQLNVTCTHDDDDDDDPLS